MENNNSLQLMPSASEFEQLVQIADMAVKSQFLPYAVNTKEKAVVIALKGRELGLPPMLSFSNINVIQGKPVCSAELMLSEIRRLFKDCEIIFKENTKKSCKILAKRHKNDKEYSEFSMTFDDAYEAGFAKAWDKDKKQWIVKDNWQKQPDTMLMWRCISKMKRFLFSEVLMGIGHTPEEIEPDETIPSGPAVDVKPKDVTPAKSIKAEVVEEAPPQKLKNYAPQSQKEVEERKTQPVDETKKTDLDLALEKEAVKPDDGAPTYDEVWQSIVQTCEALKMNPKDLSAFVMEHFGKPIAQYKGDLQAMINIYSKLLEKQSMEA